MKHRFHKTLRRMAVVVGSACVAGLASATIVLHPGYVTGTVTIGDYNVYSVNINANGSGYRASKSVAGDTYTLTVEGGDWDYSVGATAYVRPVGAYYPYTYMTFNSRTLQVPVGSTVSNDYAFADAATIRFQVNITGDPYSNWYGYGYAVQNVAPPAERTYSQSYTHSNYSPLAEWDMPVVPNDNIRVYARVRVDSRWYNFWYSPDLRYENIGPGETLVVPLDIVHTAIEPPLPPEYEYGTVLGTVDLTVSEPEAFRRHRVNGSGSRYVYENPGSYSFDFVVTGTRTFWADSWFDDYRTYLRWPYTGGDYLNDRILVQANQTYIKDFVSDSGVLTGNLAFTGSLAETDLSRVLYAYGAANFYDPVNGWVPQSTSGGHAYQSKSMGDPETTYRLFLNPGPWLPYRVNASYSDSSQGYSQGFSLNVYDYNHYYNGSNYDFGAPTYVDAGAITVEDREYCTGSVVVGFRDDSGGTLSYPRLSASGAQRTETGKTAVSASGSGYSNVRDALQPEVEIHAPPGDYNLSSITFRAQDGTNLTFPGFPISFECGVRKGVPISGKPRIVITQPPAYFLTDGQTVTVSGIASDDNGIASMTLNGEPLAFQVTGNPENEVGFSVELAVQDGTNAIVTEATDVDGNVSFDERDIYVDGWTPTVTIVSPQGGAVFPDPQPSAPLQVTASDQGYGFDLTVTLNGRVVCEASGAANQAAPETIACAQDIGPFDYGMSTIEAVATDAAGHQASASRSVMVNEAPTADFTNSSGAIGEGSSATLAFTNPSDTSAADTEAGFLYAYDCDDDGVFEVADSTAAVHNCSYADDGSYTANGRIADRHGAFNAYAAVVTVLNVAPTVDAGADTALECGGTYASSGSFTDPGTDTWTATVDYGDGSGVQALALNADKTFALSHVYATSTEAFTVTARVADEDGGVGVGTAIVTAIDTTAPTVTAELVLQGNGDEPDDDDEGRFVVGFSADDSCSPIATVEAVLLVPGRATPIPVVSGQVIEFEYEDEANEVEVEWESDDGISILEIEATDLTLLVTATDAAGNTATAQAAPTGLAPDNDDVDEID